MSILVVCEHTMFRDGLGLLLQSRLPKPEVQFAESVNRAIATARQTRYPTVLLADLGLPDSGGKSAVDALRDTFPGVPLIGLADDRNQPEVARALSQGARLCVLKSASAELLLAALQLVESNAICLPISLTTLENESPYNSEIRRLPGGASPTPADLGLTPKQSRVLRLLLEGKSAKGIARELGLCTGTVKTHTTAVLRALNVNTRVQAVLAARRMGLQVDVCH